MQDISERKRVETELRKITNRLSLALNSAAIGCWEWIIDSDTLIWDERMYDLYGVERYTPLVYNVWEKALHPDDLLSVTTLLKQTVLGEA